jgi:hypothetical protein
VTASLELVWVGLCADSNGDLLPPAVMMGSTRSCSACGVRLCETEVVFRCSPRFRLLDFFITTVSRYKASILPSSSSHTPINVSKTFNHHQ